MLVPAPSGDAAIKLFEKEPVSIVLMDMEMEGMDGYETVKRLRALPRGQRVPIVALTGQAAPEDRRRCLDAGCTDHVGKPFTRETLVAMVEKYRARTELGDAASPIPIPIDADLADLVPESLTEWREDAAKLSRLLEDQNFDAIRRIGHDFKGAGEPYGFVERTRLGKQIEQLAQQEDRDSLEGRIAEVQSYLARVRPVFDGVSRGPE